MEKIRETSESPMPLLLISHGKQFERHLIYKVSDNRCNVLNIPILCNKKVLGSSHGWLILVRYYINRDECCLFNPISMDIIPLPELNDIEKYYECILTKPPTEPDCHVLFSARYKLSLCRIGDNEFVNLSYLPEEPDIKFIFHAFGTFLGQTYSFTMQPYQLFGSIHFVNNNIEFRPIKLNGHTSLVPRATLDRRVWLIESPQECCLSGKVEVELLMIQKILSTGLDFRVFRIDVSKESYVEILNLGRRTIFLSDNGGGYCCNFVQGVRPNCIYYLNKSKPGSKSNDRSFHIFDLEDGSTTSQLLPSDVGYHSLTSWVHTTNLLSPQFLG